MPRAFVVDQMLGHVAKWLRIIGYDAEFANGKDDHELLRVAANEGRVLVTSDKELWLKARKLGLTALLVSPRNSVTALSEISKTLRIGVRPKMVRCTVCNGLLNPWSGERHSAGHTIPKHVRHLWTCRRCGKVYWKGTHWDKICQFLEEVSEESLRRT